MTVTTGIAALGQGVKTTPPSLAQSQLGQEDFLRLMTAQLSVQDPFDPVDNSQMIAQMAQFSSLGGISEMAATLKDIAARLDAVLPPASEGEGQ
jgi:flagellar basal-body rod modification protein FlgD